MPSGNDSLFAASSAMREPLAARMRPRNLDEYIGQDHIVGKGRLLRRAIAADQLTSVIFYGPPGSGKTTLARVIANHTKSNFITLNAVLTGVADIRTAIKQAEDYFTLYSRRTILFVDEVHRWNKSQQDALLPWVENGTIILIGATTENPFFEVNKALVSRSRVFQLKPLTDADLLKAARLALSDVERGYGHWKVEFEGGALEHLVETANGDARSLLNALELAVETTPEQWNPAAEPPVPAYGSTIYISKEAAEESIQKKVVLYDRDGDYHYDIISAFIKSLRGRDPDASMYWLARMAAAGEDPHFIFRRMLISACEDTGLADPHAVSVVNSCAQAFDRVGMPEGRYFLAHAALYLSTAPKSNSSMAFFDALAAVEKEDAEVPNHLRDDNRDAEGFGHGAGYLYPHAYRDHWVAQQYLPDTLAGRVFYTPSTQGYEREIRGEVLSRRELQIAAILERQLPAESEAAETGSRISNGAPEGGAEGTGGTSEFRANPISEWW
ncbi:MAG: AAA family ATPase, partial [Treponemataceae bacterium]|nr:AAA family ATPase [Treponemataceae bacterium]